MSTENGRGFQLGEWRVYPDQCMLENDDGPVHIEPKVMEVLAYLAHKQGEVVKRDELMQTVWNGTVVTDEVLSRAISLLRSQLGDDRMTPVYIQTLPKIGYRLLMPVSDLPSAGGEAEGASQQHKLIRWAVMAVLILVATSLYYSPEEVPIDPLSPGSFENIADWFDVLIKDNEGTSIAVEPFRNLTEDEHGEIRSESLTEELINSLSKVKGLKVVARGSLLDKSRLRNMDAYLEGSIRQEGEGLRVNMRLSDVDDGYVIWSESFNCGPEELFSLQENLTAGVVTQLIQHFAGSNLEPPEPVAEPPNQEAYHLFLQQEPNNLWRMRGEGPLRTSIKMSTQMTDIDPGFSRAHIRLASSQVLLPFYSSEPMELWFQRAEQVLDDHLFTERRDRGDAESIRAFIAWHRWHWIEAEERFRRALELAPLSANIYQWYSQHLAYVGRKQDSLAAALRAKELDDISPAINNRLGVAYLWLDQNSKATEHFAISRHLGFHNEFNPAYLLVLWREERVGDFTQAMTDFYRGDAETPRWLIDGADLLLDPNNRNKALALAQEAKEQGQLIKPELEFSLWITLGGNDLAYETFYALQESYKKHLQLEIVFAEEGRSFRGDSRFDELSEEIGWAEYWRTVAGPDDL